MTRRYHPRRRLGLLGTLLRRGARASKRGVRAPGVRYQPSLALPSGEAHYSAVLGPRRTRERAAGRRGAARAQAAFPHRRRPRRVIALRYADAGTRADEAGCGLELLKGVGAAD